MSFREVKFPLVDWLDENLPRTRYNLASSGLESPDLEEFGIETDLSKLTSREDKFEEELSRVYGPPPSEFLPCAGATFAIFLAISSLVKSGDRVLIPMPNYPAEYCVPKTLGARVQEFKLDYEEKKFHLDPDDFAGEITRETKMVILTNSNNPTGLKIERKSLEKIAAAAEKSGSFLFVDETFREFAEDPAPVGRTLGDHVISAGSMTKYFGLDEIKAGWLVAAQPIMDKIRAVNRWVTISLSRLCSAVAAQAMEKKSLFDERAKSITRENVLAAEKFIEQNSEFLEWVKPDGAPYGFPKIKIGGLSSKRFCELLIDRFAILQAPGEFFEYPGHARMCLTRSPEKTKLALNQLSIAIAKIAGTRQLPYSN